MIGQARVSFDLIRSRVGLTGSIDESGSERLLWIATAGADDGTHCVTSSEANEGARPTGDPSVRFFPPVAPPSPSFFPSVRTLFFFPQSTEFGTGFSSSFNTEEVAILHGRFSCCGLAVFSSLWASFFFD